MMLLDQLISWQADLEVRQHIEERNLFAMCFELVSDQMQASRIVNISGPPANARGCCQNSEGGGAVEVLLGTAFRCELHEGTYYCRCLCRVLRLTCNASSGFVDVT